MDNHGNGSVVRIMHVWRGKVVGMLKDVKIMTWLKKWELNLLVAGFTFVGCFKVVVLRTSDAVCGKSWIGHKKLVVSWWNEVVNELIARKKCMHDVICRNWTEYLE